MKKHYYRDDIIRICEHKHLSAEEIFFEIKKIFPDAGMSSIYRNIDEMVKKKVLKKITGLSPKALFETEKGAHAHFICDATKKIYDIPLSCLKNLKLPSEFNWHTVEMRIYGTYEHEKKDYAH